MTARVAGQRGARPGIAVVLAWLLPCAQAWADEPCRVFSNPASRLMVCRGGQSSGFAPPTDTDWAMPFRAARGETRPSLGALEPGTCRWETGPIGPHVARRIVFPFAGPLVTDAYPIGPQARTCAGEVRCVMTFCARESGPFLEAVDGFIRLSFW